MMQANHRFGKQMLNKTIERFLRYTTMNNPSWANQHHIKTLYLGGKPTPRLWQLLMLIELSWRWEKQSDTTNKKNDNPHNPKHSQPPTKHTSMREQNASHSEAHTESDVGMTQPINLAEIIWQAASTKRRWDQTSSRIPKPTNKHTMVERTLRDKLSRQPSHAHFVFHRRDLLPRNPLILMKPWFKRTLRQPSHSHDKQQRTTTTTQVKMTRKQSPPRNTENLISLHFLASRWCTRPSGNQTLTKTPCCHFGTSQLVRMWIDIGAWNGLHHRIDSWIAMADLINRRTVSKCTLDTKTLHTENLKTHEKLACSTSTHCFVIVQAEIENKLWFIHQNIGPVEHHWKAIRRKTSPKPTLKNKTDSMGFKHTWCIIIKKTNTSSRAILWMGTSQLTNNHSHLSINTPAQVHHRRSRETPCFTMIQQWQRWETENPANHNDQFLTPKRTNISRSPSPQNVHNTHVWLLRTCKQQRKDATLRAQDVDSVTSPVNGGDDCWNPEILVHWNMHLKDRISFICTASFSQTSQNWETNHGRLINKHRHNTTHPWKQWKSEYEWPPPPPEMPRFARLPQCTPHWFKLHATTSAALRNAANDHSNQK